MARLTFIPNTAGVGGGEARIIDKFTATDLQTEFALTQTPTSPANVALSVNGLEYTGGTDFSVIGSTLTWLDVIFTLGAGDTLLANYHS